MSSHFDNYMKYQFLDACWNTENGIVTVTLKRPPVNSITSEFLKELSALLNELERDEAQGLILTSEYNGVFSAGIDFKELYQPVVSDAKEFMTLFKSFTFSLTCTAFPTVAVINGHTPGAGAVIPLCCEYRIMLDNFTIGLNELRLGLQMPDWLSSSMTHIIGKRNAEKAILRGTLFSSEDALKIGLIDEIASTKADAMEKASEFLNSAKILNRTIRLDTKLHIRKSIIQDFEKDTDKEINRAVSFLMSADMQQTIGNRIKALKEKRQK
ncbi:hypothetical protein RI129_008678 [Pyrocoelia pectoralis]|uniref:Enoyl-CoA hydratase n=1 Tax=Pyrocoelia pectoralis TaxID=417401 RepID=A0AAN7VCE6_9COLE